jgi:hypothetical protein
MTEEQLREVLDVNMIGAFHVIKVKIYSKYARARRSLHVYRVGEVAWPDNSSEATRLVD